MRYHTEKDDIQLAGTTEGEALTVNSVGINTVGRGGVIRTDYTTLRAGGRRDWHLLLLMRGCCHATYEGENFDLYAGDALIYAPGQAQKYTFYAAEDNACGWVHFAGREAPRLMEQWALSPGVLRGTDDAQVPEAFSHLLGEYALNRPGRDALMAAWLTVLLGALARERADGSGGQTGARRRMTRVIYDIAEGIRRDPARAGTVGEYAGAAGWSVDRFSRVFREIMGQPPHVYIREAKLSLARRLLRESELSVGEISDALNFEDALYFSRLFRRCVGIPPREYRRRTAERPEKTGEERGTDGTGEANGTGDTDDTREHPRSAREI